MKWSKIFILAILVVALFFVLDMVLPADIEYRELINVFLSALIGGAITEYISVPLTPKSPITREEY